MNRTALMIAFALVGAGSLSAQNPRAADEIAIQTQLSGYAAARQIGDGHTQALFYAEDADEWGAGAMEMTKGRTALEKTLNSPPDPNRRFRIEAMNYSFLGKDVALVDAFFYGAKAEPSGHALYVMVKRDNQWLIRSARIMRFPTAAAK